MMSNQIYTLDRNFQNRDEIIKIQRPIQEDTLLNKNNDTRVTQDSPNSSYIQNLVLKTPNILQTSNRVYSLNRVSNGGDIQDSIKKLEVIKNKHSQKFKETHFSMERIGLNPSAHTNIVYKKQSNKCVNSIKEYICNLGMSYETEMKSPSGQYLKKQINQGRNQNYYPIIIESIQNNDSRNFTKNMKNNSKIIKDEIEQEYSQKLIEMLKDIFVKKRKQKDVFDINQNQPNQLNNQNKNDIKKQSIITNEQTQDTLDHLPPRYKRETKSPLPLNLVQKTKTNTGTSSPITHQERIFSPPKRLNQRQLPLYKIAYSQQNKSDLQKSHSPIPTPYKSPQCKSPIQQSQSRIFKEEKSAQLYESMINKKNYILVEGGAFNKTALHDDKKNNQLIFSKDDMNQTQNERQNNKIQNIQYRKCSSPMRNNNKFNIQKIFMINDVKREGEKQKDVQQKSNQNNEYQNQKSKELQKSQAIQQNDSSEYNIDFLKIQNFGRRYTKYNNRNTKQQNLSKTQFDDSSYLNDSSIIKEQEQNENTQDFQKQQSKENILKQESISSQQNIQDQKNNSIDSSIKSKPQEKNVKEQQLTGNGSIILESMASYEETSEILKQIALDKQSKVSKHLNKLGLNNRYSKKDYLKEQNCSITQEFLDINFDANELKPKQKTQSTIKGLNQSQIIQKDDEIQTIINQSQQYSNTRYLISQPQVSPNQIKENQKSSQNNIQQQTLLDLSYHMKEQRQRLKSVQSQNNREQVILPKVTSKSPDVSRNMSIMYQCQQEIKNLNYLSKKWERNMDKMAEERSLYNQRFRNMSEQDVLPEKALVFSYYQNQRFNTDI